MKESYINKIAFGLWLGHSKYVVMPFGLTNTPTTLIILMNTLFHKKLGKFILVFVDDILIYYEIVEEYKIHHWQIFDVMRFNKLSQAKQA